MPNEKNIFDIYNSTDSAQLVRVINSFEDDLFLERAPGRGWSIQGTMNLGGQPFTNAFQPMVDCINWTIPDVAKTVSLGCSSSAETGSLIMILYLDTTLSQKSAFVVTNGTSIVSTGITDFYRAQFMFLLSPSYISGTTIPYISSARMWLGSGAFSSSTGFAANYQVMSPGFNVAGSPLTVIQTDRKSVV